MPIYLPIFILLKYPH